MKNYRRAICEAAFMGFGLSCLIGLFLLWYLMTPARAQDGWLPRTKCEWKHGKERCARRHRSGMIEYHWTGAARRYPEVRHYRAEEEPRCKSLVVTAIGEEKYGTDRAKEAAAATWMERVRFLYGVRFMDTRNAKHSSYECSRSSTGNRASEKTADLAGRFLEQCELRAEPCKAEKERGSE